MLFFLNEGGSRISNITFPCVMKVMKATRISLHFFTFLCISLHFSSFLCISLHFSTFHCISLHFSGFLSAFLYISLHFSTFHWILVYFSAFLWISLHFSTFLCISLHFTFLWKFDGAHRRPMDAIFFYLRACSFYDRGSNYN